MPFDHFRHAAQKSSSILLIGKGQTFVAMHHDERRHQEIRKRGCQFSRVDPGKQAFTVTNTSGWDSATRLRKPPHQVVSIRALFRIDTRGDAGVKLGGNIQEAWTGKEKSRSKRYETMTVLKLVLVLILALMSGCKESSPSHFGSSWNPEREKRGVRLVPDKAVLWNPGDSNGELWILEGQPPGAPRWGGKEVEVIAGKAAHETDVFYGPRYIDLADGPSDSVLRIGYDYSKEAAGQSPWDVSLADGVDPMGRTLSFNEAKRILETWSLSY